MEGHVDVTITNDLRVGSIALIWALIESGSGLRSQLTISALTSTSPSCPHIIPPAQMSCYFAPAY